MAQLTGYGAGNTVLAVNDIAAFNLSDTILSRTGRGDMALSAIQIANLTGGASANTFTVSKWSGNGTLDGKEGGDTYNLTLAGTGTGTINVTDSGFTGTDTLNVTASRTTSVTSTSVRVGTQRVSYGTSGIEVLNVKGGTAGVGSVTFNVQSTNATVSTTVRNRWEFEFDQRRQHSGCPAHLGWRRQQHPRPAQSDGRRARHREY